ncbi:Ferredoxin-NADP reductase [Halomicrobium zhouii]|uniref:Ferredoxin-NADP reductase n=1 Tax=Halomicrobium zhouii TaxID=767519 RepID=A0A1I6L3P0_9EURY|nr:FAD-dependent oxidoreductase [Halomicrobium zhouii]SFR98054.1 Ferredoxin-NADP reductase [Halomicrobium zhouii]
MTITVTVADVHQMTPDVKQFRLVADDHTFEFRPGQHTHIHFQDDDGEEVERPYTAITQPGTGQICLAIKRYDDGTASVWMHDRSPGDEIEIDPVDGNLYVRETARDAVFAATGTGITPIFPMVKQYAREGEGQAHLVFGERDQDHLIFRESLDQLRAENENLAVDYVLSRAEEDWPGRTGHVQDHLPDALDAVDLDAADCYVCGVPQMVVETADLLEDEGADEERIFTEGWEADAAEE